MATSPCWADFLVGGIRTLEDMAAVLDAGVDMVSLSRPLICEPDLIPKLRAGGAPRCAGCNRCFTLYEKEGRRCALHEKRQQASPSKGGRL